MPTERKSGHKTNQEVFRFPQSDHANEFANKNGVHPHNNYIFLLTFKGKKSYRQPSATLTSTKQRLWKWALKSPPKYIYLVMFVKLAIFTQCQKRMSYFIHFHMFYIVKTRLTLARCAASGAE